MKVKRVLRFYFFAEGLERTLDKLIMKTACAPDADAEGGAERILKLIDEKRELSKLWSYLDGILSGFTEAERGALKSYAALRCGLKRLDDDGRKSLRRAVMKFTRRARRIESFRAGLQLVSGYYCIICPYA